MITPALDYIKDWWLRSLHYLRTGSFVCTLKPKEAVFLQVSQISMWVSILFSYYNVPNINYTQYFTSGVWMLYYCHWSCWVQCRPNNLTGVHRRSAMSSVASKRSIAHQHRSSDIRYWVNEALHTVALTDISVKARQWTPTQLSDVG